VFELQAADTNQRDSGMVVIGCELLDVTSDVTGSQLIAIRSQVEDIDINPYDCFRV